ncbi:putative enhancer of polycomb protein [Tanacetum coccineum]
MPAGQRFLGVRTIYEAVCNDVDAVKFSYWRCCGKCHVIRKEQMPSVEMRRTTRVFGARVLRSGRRLFTSPQEVIIRHMRKNVPLAVDDDVEQGWFELLEHHRGGGVKKKRNLNDKNTVVDEVLEVKLAENETKVVDSVKSVEQRVDEDGGTGDKRFGTVYTRKRKRSVVTDDKKFGKKFYRKRIKTENSPSVLLPNDTTVTKLSSVLPQKNTIVIGLASVFPQNDSVVTDSTSAVPQNDANVTEPSFPVKLKTRRKKIPRVAVARPTRSNYQLRSGVMVHRGILKKQRSSLRTRRQGNLSTFGHLKSGGAKDDNVPFFPIKSNPEIHRSIQRSFREIQSRVVGSTQNVDSARCNANILVIESDRCYREGGAVVSIEMSGCRKCYLVVKRNGVERFRVQAGDVMKPCFCNRVTRAIIWPSGDGSWRLEFPDRHDWSIFKELYRKCSERPAQVHASLASIIPVPRVNEVLGYAEEKCSPFKLPDSYIRSTSDEVTRVLEKSVPAYDMDSDDDVWLNKFNTERDTPVDEDTFEKIIDAYERGIYGSPADYSDVTLAIDRCSMLASNEVLKAVYGYWMAKRKKKRSPLVRVFQFYKPRKPERLNFKTVLRKKRSFRRRGSQSGRGKQLTFLNAAFHETNTTEEADNATSNVQEAETAAERAEQVAIAKRQRAQLKMEVADLLTYKAVIAHKIAEARATSGSVDDDINDDHLFFPMNSSGST